MDGATFRSRLAERGCRFDHQHEERGKGPASVTIHREGRTAELPLAGSHKPIDLERVPVFWGRRRGPICGPNGGPGPGLGDCSRSR